MVVPCGTPKSSILVGVSLTLYVGVPPFMETPMCHDLWTCPEGRSQERRGELLSAGPAPGQAQIVGNRLVPARGNRFFFIPFQEAIQQIQSGFL